MLPKYKTKSISAILCSSETRLCIECIELGAWRDWTQSLNEDDGGGRSAS